MDIININDLYQAFKRYVNSNACGSNDTTNDFQLAVNITQNEMWNEYMAQAEKSNES